MQLKQSLHCRPLLPPSATESSSCRAPVWCDARSRRTMKTMTPKDDLDDLRVLAGSLSPRSPYGNQQNPNHSRVSPCRMVASASSTSMMRLASHASAKAWAIATGLVNTGRGVTPVAVRGYICVRSARAGYYWISNTGDRLLYGLGIDSAVDLQPGFVESMERSGDQAGRVA